MAVLTLTCMSDVLIHCSSGDAGIGNVRCRTGPVRGAVKQLGALVSGASWVGEGARDGVGWSGGAAGTPRAPGSQAPIPGPGPRDAHVKRAAAGWVGSNRVRVFGRAKLFFLHRVSSGILHFFKVCG